MNCFYSVTDHWAISSCEWQKQKQFPPLNQRDCYLAEKVIYSYNNYWLSLELNEFFLHAAQLQRAPTPIHHHGSAITSTSVWPHDRRLPHRCQPDFNDMETVQLPTSRTVRGNQQAASPTWHSLPVYVKEGGKAALHLNVLGGRAGAERR